MGSADHGCMIRICYGRTRVPCSRTHLTCMAVGISRLSGASYKIVFNKSEIGKREILLDTVYTPAKGRSYAVPMHSATWTGRQRTNYRGFEADIGCSSANTQPIFWLMCVTSAVCSGFGVKNVEQWQNQIPSFHCQRKRWGGVIRSLHPVQLTAFSFTTQTSCVAHGCGTEWKVS